MVLHVVAVNGVDVVVAEQDLGEVLVALALEMVLDVVHLGDREVELLLLEVQLDLDLLQVLDDPLVGLAYLLPHPLKYLALLAVVLLDLLVVVRQLDRHTALRVPQQFYMVDQYLVAVLFVLDIALVFLLFEEPESVDVLIEQVVLADTVDKLPALADDAWFYLLRIDPAQIFFRYL